VDTLITIGSERLYNNLLKRFSTPAATQSPNPVAVVKVANSGGCVDRDDTFKKANRLAQLKNYFFGSDKRVLSPHHVTLDVDKFPAWEVVDAMANTVNTSFLPIGHEEVETAVLQKIVLSLQHESSLVAIMHADQTDGEEAIAESSVMGFMQIQEVDEQTKKLKALVPVPGRIPNKALVVGKWPEPMFLT